MIYFDNAATTFPKPDEVSEEVQRCIKEYCGNPGRGSHFMSRAAGEALYECREKLSALFGAPDPSYCVFTLNTTYALNIALKTAVSSGDHILISDMEHNSVYRQVVKLKEQGTATFDIFGTFLGDEEKIMRDIKRKVKYNTKILICQIASNVCAFRMPVERIGELCKKKGIKFIADAAQSAGIFSTDISTGNIYALCIPSHKGLYGPQGAGAVIYSSSHKQLKNTLIEGGSGSNSLSPYMPDDLPDRFEGGTMPTPAVAGLSKGIDHIVRIGIDRIRNREKELARILYGELKSDSRYIVYGNSPEYGIVMFNVSGIPSTEIASELDKRGICTRSGFHCSPLAHKTLSTGNSGAVRVSFGIFNEKSEIYRFLDVLSMTVK